MIVLRMLVRFLHNLNQKIFLGYYNPLKTNHLVKMQALSLAFIRIFVAVYLKQFDMYNEQVLISQCALWIRCQAVNKFVANCVRSAAKVDDNPGIQNECTVIYCSKTNHSYNNTSHTSCISKHVQNTPQVLSS